MRTPSGFKALIAAADVREISDEFATVAHHLRDLLTPDGLILLLGTKSGIRVICRAMTDDIDFGSMMKKYNGGGHKRAASAMIPLEITDETDMSAALASLKEDMIKTTTLKIKRTKEQEAIENKLASKGVTLREVNGKNLDKI